MDAYYEPDSQYREPLTDTDAFLDSARYNEEGDAALLRKYLDDHPADIDAKDDQGRTAVHMAAANGHVTILEMLFEFSPCPDIANNEGNTALHYAALNNRVAAAEMLLQREWSPAVQNLSGKTPLQLIYEKKFDEMETLLMSHDQTLDNYVPPAGAAVDIDADDSGEEFGAESAGNEAPKKEKEPHAAPEGKQPADRPKDVKDHTTGEAMLGSANVDDIE